MTIGDKFEMIREQLDIQKQELADALGITPQYYSGIINGKKNPSQALLKRLSKLANIDEAFFDDDVEAIDIKESELIMSYLPNDVREWVSNKQSKPYIILAKMIHDNKLNSDELDAIIKIIRADRDEN